MAVDKQTENRAQRLKIHHQCTERKPGATGAATGKGADEEREDPERERAAAEAHYFDPVSTSYRRN